MKKTLLAILICAGLVATLASPAAAQSTDLTGIDVTVENTIQAPAFGLPDEGPFGSQGPATVGAGVEFALCCDGFYDIDISANTISMVWVGDDAQYARVIEDGTFDRYYFTFDEPILAGAVSNPGASLQTNVTVVSPTELTVEIGPGNEIGTGFDALIDITVTTPQLAVTGVSSAQLAFAGFTIALLGAGLVVFSRKRTFELS